MDRYIGVDAHAQSCTIAVMSAAGKRLQEARVETNGDALRGFLRGLAGRKYLNAVYRSRGLTGMGAAIYDTARREEWLEKLPEHRRELAVILSIQMDALIATHKRAEEWLREEAERLPLINLLTTVPGIGEIRAAQIVGTVVSPHRFRTRRQFMSYCGLGIVTRSSSDWSRAPDGRWERRLVAQPRGLNRNRHPILKRVFRGAADVVIRAQGEHPLYVAYQRATAR